MVEFPLVGPVARVCAPARNLSQIPPFADINFASSKAVSDPIGMWETNTFIASFHARLNVALRHDGEAGYRTVPQSPGRPGNGVNGSRPAASICHKFRSTVAGFWFSA